jgi:hypothetical protein
MKDSIEEAAEKFYSEQSKAYEDIIEPIFDNSRYLVAGFIDGAKWQQERTCNHNYILTSEQSIRIIKCPKCNHSQTI